ncbi:MAG: YgaP family membrane protein [Anaerolineaceae bacterium]
MKKNMGNLDRIIRAIVAVVISILYFSGVVSGTLGIVLLVIAGILLATSVVAFCPLYFPFKFSTRK